MRENTPFFTEFRKILFGRRKPGLLAKIIQEKKHWAETSLSDYESIFGSWIDSKYLEKSSQGSNSRNRIFSARVTFWAFLSQILTCESSCREAVRKVMASALKHYSGNRISQQTGAYCLARQRLEVGSLEKILTHTAEELRKQIPQEQLWKGRAVKVVDGTTIWMPDTAALQKLYPQPSGQKKGCGFPVIKILGLFCLSTGVLLGYAKSHLNRMELSLFQEVRHLFKKGDILLGDRAYCSYGQLATMMTAGVDCVIRLHQRRPIDYRRGQKLGKNDQVVEWTKPYEKPSTLSEEEFKALPQRMKVRQLSLKINIKGFRTTVIHLVTTLLDPLEYPAEGVCQDICVLGWFMI